MGLNALVTAGDFFTAAMSLPEVSACDVTVDGVDVTVHVNLDPSIKNGPRALLYIRDALLSRAAANMTLAVRTDYLRSIEGDFIVTEGVSPPVAEPAVGEEKRYEVNVYMKPAQGVRRYEEEGYVFNLNASKEGLSQMMKEVLSSQRLVVESADGMVYIYVADVEYMSAIEQKDSE